MNTTINRRHFIKSLAGVIGVSAATTVTSGNAFLSAMRFASSPKRSSSTNSFFTFKQFVSIKAIVDTILPKTDTPSGSELNCHNFCDHQIYHCYDAEQQKGFAQLIEAISDYSIQKLDKRFEEITKDQQFDLLTAIEMNDAPKSIDMEQFSNLKSLIVFGYFTSQIGATQVLNYQAVPGGFKGSIPYTEASRAWGSLAYY